MPIMRKKILIAVLSILGVLIIVNWQLITYGIAQGKGQLKIIRGAVPIEDALRSKDFPDSLKENLSLVPEIRDYAFNVLDLKENNNYTSVYNQEGRELLWVVTACDPYKFEPITWSFPIIGSFTYKGFFDIEKAKELVNDLKSKGLDVSARPVSGWSTLGWFNDPVLSNMLLDGEGELANTIIHELTHGTLFIPDSMTFNENLASFIGHQGSIRFLESKYGRNSVQAREYLNLRNDSKLLSKHLVRTSQELDTLYHKIEYMDEKDKKILKQGLIEMAILAMDTLDFSQPERYAETYQKYPPNNAFLISFLSYRERQDDFEKMLEQQFSGDLKLFIQYWQQEYGS